MAIERVLVGTQRQPLMELKAYEFDEERLDFEAARAELTGELNGRRYAALGYFPLNNRSAVSMPKCQNLAAAIRIGILADPRLLDLDYSLSFMKATPHGPHTTEQQPLRLDTDLRETQVYPEVPLHIREITRLLFNGSSAFPQTVEYIELNQVAFGDRAIEDSAEDVESLELSELKDTDRMSVDIPARVPDVIHGLKFVSSLLPYAEVPGPESFTIGYVAYSGPIK